MAPAVLRNPSVLPRQFPAGADASNPTAGARAKAKAKAKAEAEAEAEAGAPASALVIEFEFEFDLSSPGYPAGQERRWKCLQRWGAGAAQNRRRQGPEACLGRVGQDAQPRSCRVRRIAHTCKAPTSLHGCIHSVFCAAPTPQRPSKANRQLLTHGSQPKKRTARQRRPSIAPRAAGSASIVSQDQPARPPPLPPWPRPRPPPLPPPPRRWP